MANTKLSALTALTDAASDDVLYIVDDPDGTAASRKITLSNLLKVVNTLDALTSPAAADTVYVVDDPSGTPTGKKITLSDVLKAANVLDALTTPAGEDVLYVVDDPTGTPAPKKVTVANLFKDRTMTGYLELPSDGSLYYGDTDTNGSYRLKADTDGILMQEREGGAWVTQTTIRELGDRTSLTGSTVESDDVLFIVDTSASDEEKKITVGELMDAIEFKRTYTRLSVTVDAEADATAIDMRNYAGGSVQLSETHTNVYVYVDYTADGSGTYTQAVDQDGVDLELQVSDDDTAVFPDAVFSLPWIKLVSNVEDTSAVVFLKA